MPTTFRALRHRGFRLLWTGLVVSAVGTWMQIIAQSLLVLSITHGSPIALGAVSIAQAASFFLFALIGGGVADRIDKRRLLLFTQSLSMLLALMLGVLAQTGTARVWMIVAIAFCNGAVLSFDQPARGALIPELVPKEDLMNAISLQSVVFNGASALGPALSGLTIAAFGLAANFFLNALSYLGVLIALVRLGDVYIPRKTTPIPLLKSVRGLLAHLAGEPVLPWVLSAYGAMFFFGPSLALLLPIYATTVMHTDARGLGFLFSASGLGTVVGAFTLASLGDVKRKGALFLGALLAWASALILFATARSLWWALPALFLFGMAQNGVGGTAITLMQTRVPQEMRGRVMSLNSLLMMGVRPLGDFPAAASIALFGAALTTMLAAGIVGVWSVVVMVAKPSVRRA